MLVKLVLGGEEMRGLRNDLRSNTFYSSQVFNIPTNFGSIDILQF